MCKNTSFVSVLLLAIILLTLTGCESLNRVEGEELDMNLVGVWFWDDNSGFEYLFNDDGTGIRGWPGESSPFTWSTTNSTLFIECQGTPLMFGVRNERWTYIIDNENLTITSQQSRNLSYGYIRDGNLGDVAQELVGTWFWEDSVFWTYVFHEDGTGFAGWVFEEFEFNWGVSGNVLRIEVLGYLPKYAHRIETWRFNTEDSLLHLTTPDSEVFSYYMDHRNWETDPTLVGTWAWLDYFNWVYVFNPDGTATRGPYYDYMEFTWGVYGDEVRYFYDGKLFDSWFFSFINGHLRLESRYDTDIVFYYAHPDDLEEIHQESQINIDV